MSATYSREHGLEVIANEVMFFCNPEGEHLTISVFKVHENYLLVSHE